MPHFECRFEEDLEEEFFPLQSFSLQIALDLDFGDVKVPETAARRMAKRTVERVLQELDCHDQGPLLLTTEPEPDLGNGDWIQPVGIDLRIIKSAHRVVQAIGRRGESGRAVLASELVQDGLVSAPTMSRLLRDDETAGQYLAPYILISPAGRTKALDLTPKGRVLASKIRAGVIPN